MAKMVNLRNNLKAALVNPSQRKVLPGVTGRGSILAPGSVGPFDESNRGVIILALSGSLVPADADAEKWLSKLRGE